MGLRFKVLGFRVKVQLVLKDALRYYVLHFGLLGELEFVFKRLGGCEIYDFRILGADLIFKIYA